MKARSRGKGGNGGLLKWQVALGIALLAIWQIGSELSASPWLPRPTDVVIRLAEWFSGEIYLNVLVTLVEMAVGLAAGGILGAIAGILLGRAPTAAMILRPVIVAMYSVPLIALAPLFIMFFGIGMLPKIVMIAIVSFFLLFFNAFSGATAVDSDLVQSLQLMGASRFEEFRKVVAPGCMVWIISGFKTALPYALVGATTGEMLAARDGVGFLLNRSVAQFDLAGLFAALLVLMAVGLLMAEAGARIDRWLLRWRPENVGTRIQ